MPTGVPIDLNSILNLTQSVGGFLLAVGGILATITIIVSGIMYLFAGSNQQSVTTAKKVLVGGMIGALIIFGAGVIINTVRNFASNPFQFFGGSGPAPATCSGGIRIGQSCFTNADCPNDAPGTCGGTGQPICSNSQCL